MEVILVVVGVLVGAGLVYFLMKKTLDSAQEKDKKGDSEGMVLLQSRIDNLTKLLDERLERQGSETSRQIRDFTENVTKMDASLKNVHQSVSESVGAMQNFQNIFKTPKLRGNWGESNLRYLLEQTYPKEQLREQYSFKDGGESVDFAVLLPNDYILPIDSKFPLEVFTAYSEEENPDIKARRRTDLVAAVKREIDAIASKYIRPHESTTDLALLYVPAEAVYYELMFGSKDTSLDEYAKRKKVILVSPNTLHLTLRVIEHWFKDMTVAKETREIIKRLGTVMQDGEKLTESYSKLGKHLHNAQGAFEEAGKRAELLSGRVKKVISIGEAPIDREAKND